MKIVLERPTTFFRFILGHLPLFFIIYGLIGVMLLVLMQVVPKVNWGDSVNESPHIYWESAGLLALLSIVFLYKRFFLFARRFPNNPYKLSPDLYYIVDLGKEGVVKALLKANGWDIKELSSEHFICRSAVMAGHGREERMVKLVIHIFASTSEGIWILSISQDRYAKRTSFKSRYRFLDLLEKEVFSHVEAFLESTELSRHLINFRFQPINISWEKIGERKAAFENQKIAFQDGPFVIPE